MIPDKHSINDDGEPHNPPEESPQAADASMSVPANEPARLAALRHYRILDTLPEKPFDDLAWLIAAICNTPVSWIALLAAERQWFKARIGLNTSEWPRTNSFCNHTIRQSDQPLIIPDTLQDPRFQQHPLVVGPPYLRFYAGAPLVTAQGEVLGTICVADTQPRELSVVQITALTTLSRSVMNEIELRLRTNDIANRQQALAEMVHHLSAEHDSDRILQKAVLAIQQLNLWESVGISLLCPDGQHWQTRAEDRMEPGELGKVHSIHSGVIGRAYRSGRIQHVPDVRADPDFFLGEDVGQTGSELAVPITFGHIVLGVMNLESTQPNAFHQDDISFAQSICEIVATALKNAQRFADLHTSNQLFTQMAEHVQEVFWTFDCRQHKLIYISPAYEQIWGRSRDERFAGLHHHCETLLPEDHAVLADAQQRQDRGESTAIEYRIMRPDGTIRWIYDRGFPIFDQNGELIRVTGIATDITARKQAEDRNRYLASLIDNISDAIISCDPHFVIRSWNRAAETIYGRRADDVIGKSISEVLPTEYLHDQPEAVSARFQSQGFWRGEVIQRRSNGTAIHILASVVMVRDAEGNPSEVIAVNRDISEQKQAEAALRLSEEKYRGLMESLDTVIATVDANGRLLYLNDVAAAHLGARAEALVGKTLHDLFPVAHADQQLAVIRNILHKDHGITIESCAPVLGGERWFRTSIQPIHNEHGEPVYVLVNSTDIHELKTIQQELLDLTHTLEDRVRQRTAEVHDLYDNAPTGYHSLDQHGLIIMINQTELNWLGYTRAEMIGRPLTDFITPDSRQIFAQQFPHLKQQGWVRDVEYEFVRKDGSIMPGLLSATAIYDQHGSFVLSRSTILDNTERKKAEAALRVANTEMERALRTKDEFLANMSHELRTPLNAILALSESLIEGVRGPLSPRQHESLQHIEQSGRHLLELINDILDLAKVEAGHLDLQIEPVSVADICRTSLQFVREIALKKHLQLGFQLNDELADIDADPKRLKQILVNLLSNAVKFTPTGGKVSLEVTVHADTKTAQFAVRDTGIGIAAEDMARLFNPFTQLDSSLSRQHEGTGLGLTLVKQLVILHGGTIDVESDLNKGSCFTITLPQHHQQAGLTEAPPPLRGQLAFRSVLVVDDSLSASEQLSRYLHELAVRTISYAQGISVVEHAAGLQPEIIFLDLLMPGRSGWEILADLKADPRTKAIPVVIMSVVDDRIRGMSTGAAGYIVKPFSRESLHQVLQRIAPPRPEPPQTIAQEHRPRPAGARVLVVEDNEVNLQSVRDYLHEKGFQVEVARNGREALEQAAAVQPQVILMDIQMPEMDGLEAIKHLRANPAFAATPIVALTALAMPGDRERCLAAGANEYLTKPVRLKQLFELVQQLLA